MAKTPFAGPDWSHEPPTCRTQAAGDRSLSWDSGFFTPQEWRKQPDPSGGAIDRHLNAMFVWETGWFNQGTSISGHTDVDLLVPE